MSKNSTISDVEIVATFCELQREATHKNLYIQVDEYIDEFCVYDYTDKPAKLIGRCKSLTELMSIITDCWQDSSGTWHSS